MIAFRDQFLECQKTNNAIYQGHCKPLWCIKHNTGCKSGICLGERLTAVEKHHFREKHNREP